MRIVSIVLMLVFWLVGMAEAQEENKSGATNVLSRLQAWLDGPIQVEVRNEATGARDQFRPAAPVPESVPRSGKAATRRLAEVSLDVTERWSDSQRGLAWELDFSGVPVAEPAPHPRAGHEVIIDLPILAKGSHIFTPSERGVMALATYPTFTPVSYAHYGWTSGRYYVLPLVSVFDLASDAALTVALPPEENIPHLQVQWSEGRDLRLRLAHRAMGGQQSSPLRLRFYAHPADYRAVLGAYSDEFPRCFRPALPRGPYEGAFWYHHIHDHPDFDEMARQGVRFTWTSFWFTHLGEYLPAERQWAPYTYARWWKLREMMSDEKIRAFVRQMHEHGIGAYAYFNVTEYGGRGHQTGDARIAQKILREQLADAVVHDDAGRPIRTWEGAVVISPGQDYSLFAYLAEQLRRHVARLPEIDGFIIDRLDWASGFDYGHSDGQTMIGRRPVENMARPVSQGVAEVCRQAHAAGKRVYVNQFWRVEMLRDVDGYCNEMDVVRGLGYLAPYRPASAWHEHKPYAGDLLQFEAQLRRRLQFALMPQFIAHQFPVSQQAPDPEAADLLEIYAPLFATLDGKQQVLLPHAVKTTGPNDVNLFVNRSGQYVVPLGSRVRFLSRRTAATEEATVRLRVPDAAELSWAYVVSADGSPYRAAVSHPAQTAEIAVTRHGTASMIVAGKGPQPPLPEIDAPRLAAIRDRLFPLPEPVPRPAASRPSLGPVSASMLNIVGTSLGEPGPVVVACGGRTLGRLTGGRASLLVELPEKSLDRLPDVLLTTGDEGTWFAVERIEWLAKMADGKTFIVAKWTPEDPVASTGVWGQERYAINWTAAEEIPPSLARFAERDLKRGGEWKGKLGTRAAWIAGLDISPQGGYRLATEAKPFTWRENTPQVRALQSPAASGTSRTATCWFAPDRVDLAVVPPDREPYRLSVYLLDFDHDGRAARLRLKDTLGQVLDRQSVDIQETDKGVWLTWVVAGPVNLEVEKTAGTNVAVSGVLIDPANE